MRSKNFKSLSKIQGNSTSNCFKSIVSVRDDHCY